MRSLSSRVTSLLYQVSFGPFYIPTGASVTGRVILLGQHPTTIKGHSMPHHLNCQCDGGCPYTNCTSMASRLQPVEQPCIFIFRISHLHSHVMTTLRPGRTHPSLNVSIYPSVDFTAITVKPSMIGNLQWGSDSPCEFDYSSLPSTS